MTVDDGGYPPPNGSARTLGELFRVTRTSAGASIEQVEADLRIKAKYIEAIEDGDSAALPSRAYTDGFLRNYATYLGLDPAESVRRFAAENGLPTSSARSATVAPMPRAQSNTLTGFASPAPRRGFFGSIGRGLVALWPIVIVGGFAFAGYTGFVAARDAGMLPAALTGDAKTASVQPAASSNDPSNGDATVAAEADPVEPTQTQDTASVAVPGETAATKDDIEMADARSDIVGNETSTGRPDTLSYARPGNTPYWQAKPPAVEPADGPVADIAPENAGLLRADADDEEDKPSRWSARASVDTPPADVDASRIAAAAREALVGSLVADARQSALASAVTGATSDAAFEEQIAAALPMATQPEPESEFGIGPVVTQQEPVDLSPAEPAQAPRRFALIALADTWVQVTDAIGAVTYTGILSPGEAYNIPSQEGLKLKTGNAGGLFIEIDGRRFGPLGNSGAVMRNVVLNPGSVQASFTQSQAASLSQ